MTVRKTSQRRVNVWYTRRTRSHSSHVSRMSGLFCVPNHHCSILLQSDRCQRQRIPERRRFPRTVSAA